MATNQNGTSAGIGSTVSVHPSGPQNVRQGRVALLCRGEHGAARLLAEEAVRRARDLYHSLDEQVLLQTLRWVVIDMAVLYFCQLIPEFPNSSAFVACAPTGPKKPKCSYPSLTHQATAQILVCSVICLCSACVECWYAVKSDLYLC